MNLSFINPSRFSDLDFLEHLNALEVIEIHGVLSPDVSLDILTQLPNLTQLSAGWNWHITDWRFLEGINNLTILDLSNNQISDLSALAGLTNLTGLYLETNQTSDLSPLAGLTNLAWLGLSTNQISDLSPLAGLTNLTGLYLETNQISDLSPLAGLTKLTGLYLETNQISDLLPLAGLANLTQLYLSNNQIGDLGQLLQNTGFGSGDLIVLGNNPLAPGYCDAIKTLISRGATVISGWSDGAYVYFDCP